MAHNLFSRRMAFVGELPWHRLGTKVAPDVTSEQMLRAANLDWSVHKVPATGARPIKWQAGTQLYDRYFLQRDPVEKEEIGPVLGVVGAQYEILQNSEAFRFFDPFLEAEHAHYETAGALGNGERVWVQARLKHPIEVTTGDAVDRFILLSNSHDGKGSVSVRFTPVRVVCQNTLNLALEDGSQIVKIRHSKNMRDRLADQQVGYLLEIVEKTFKRAAEKFRTLAQTPATRDMREKFLEAMFPISPSQEKKRETPKWWQAIDDVLDDPDATTPESRDTMWGLYNAVTRAEDYRETTEATPDARLERVWFGRGADLKVRALQLAFEFCQ